MKLLKFLDHTNFQWRHLMVLFAILILFQLVVSYINKKSLENLILDAQEWYKRESAEQLANLTTTSLELMFETNSLNKVEIRENEVKLIQAFNIILHQPLLQRNVEEMCIILNYHDQVFAVDDGTDLFNYFYYNKLTVPAQDSSHIEAVNIFNGVQTEVAAGEKITSVSLDQKVFHVYVPLVPYGEYVGAVYLKIKPDFAFITEQVLMSYEQTTIIFSALILFGLLAMFYISSYTIRERDQTKEMLFRERESHLKEKINRDKESLFTKRIYHTHHKAEKIMGFIKEDLRKLSQENIEEVKNRISQYANFISRVIYDMKWYDPPLQTIRNPMFQTDLNKVAHFIVDAIFLRTTSEVNNVRFDMQLTPGIPQIHINEFVVWEIVEPLIQNAVDHGGNENLLITIKTEYHEALKQTEIDIIDNGKGINPDLLENDESGLAKIFHENTSTKTESKNSGYGCYLSYQIARRCGWKMDVKNLTGGGAQFRILINN